MIKIKSPKLSHKNEINKVDFSETIKTHRNRDVDPGVTSVDRILSREQVGGGGKWGKGNLPLFYFYLARNLGPKIAWHAREPPRRVRTSKTLIST